MRRRAQPHESFPWVMAAVTLALIVGAVLTIVYGAAPPLHAPAVRSPTVAPHAPVAPTPAATTPAATIVVGKNARAGSDCDVEGSPGVDDNGTATVCRATGDGLRWARAPISAVDIPPTTAAPSMPRVVRAPTLAASRARTTRETAGRAPAVPVALTTTSSPPGRARDGVTPGAFCARQEAGRAGTTVTGRAMHCRLDEDGRLRWRADEQDEPRSTTAPGVVSARPDVWTQDPSEPQADGR